MKRTKLLTYLIIALALTILPNGCKHPLATATQGTLCRLFFNSPGPGNLDIIKIKGEILADDDQTVLEEITISSYTILRHQIILNGTLKWEEIAFKIESEKLLNAVTVDIKAEHPELFSNKVENGNLFPNFLSIVSYSASSGKMQVRFISCSNDPVEFPTTMPELAPSLAKTGTWFVKLPDGKVLTNNPQPIKRILPATWGAIKKQP